MFENVLIANRGAIATRIILTLQQLNVKSIAVYAEADADSLHVQQADEIVSLGAGAVAETYLQADKIIQVALATGASAIHPGYGFLSENANFARACEAAGIVFLGPTPEQIIDFGLKHTARDLAESAGIPMLPGTGLLPSLEEAVSLAESIGYPVMLKSTAGGGGIGMQLCHDQADLCKAFDSVKRLGKNNFSNDGVFIEKFIQHARHIEVQIFGDGKGEVLALGERDCSAQRRNQKVIEETPAPNLPNAQQQAMLEAAIRLGRSVSYHSAGTVEFIYDAQSCDFYFLEVNTRLQVEHGVTELRYDVDLVAWMLQLGAGDLPPLEKLGEDLNPSGHAIQTRIYAENPARDFQPSAGQLSFVEFPHSDGSKLRIDHWLETGIEISPLYDPMLAKVIAHGETREQALAELDGALHATRLYGIETNLAYLRQVLATDEFRQGRMQTRSLNVFRYQASGIEIITAGTQTTIQDYPGRTGYWDVGVPPSGPMDSLSFRLGNRLLGNSQNAAGLEFTLHGPSLRFLQDTQIVLTGAKTNATLDGEPLTFYRVTSVQAGQILKAGSVSQAGTRSYLLIRGGFNCPQHLGSRATFTLGRFGGHNGRALTSGDVLHFESTEKTQATDLPQSLIPVFTNRWELRVIYGPHGAPDFFTENDIHTFFAASWEVHYNSSRTGVRLIGPKPEWARKDGGEAGLHPSNIHDNAYAVGSVDYTGDMPVILGPDGPSLGGFVCPVTVIKADLWKMGQLKAGDHVQFVPVGFEQAEAMERKQIASIEHLQPAAEKPESPAPPLATPVLKSLPASRFGESVIYRPSGEDFLLVEYGEPVLDITLRFRVHALMLYLQDINHPAIRELTPGIRSLQIHYDNLSLSLNQLLKLLEQAEAELANQANPGVPARIVHLPLSWDDEACRFAIEKYQQSVRKNAPWYPSNIEFIRRINGLDSVDQVKQIVFNANYLVMGLGDVYLGAPVATPLDPRHRLVTTKYNPARTWTAENSVGIGGSYLCVYGMEGPGGYQFVGRTLQMWNRYRKTREFEQPWLLRFFDQIRFYEVSADELKQIREDFPRGRYPLNIEPIQFNLAEYQQLIVDSQMEIDAFRQNREKAFSEELQRWIEQGQLKYESEQAGTVDHAEEETLPEHWVSVESHIAGNIWKIEVTPGQRVESDEVLLVIESMKMEIAVLAPESGVIQSILVTEGSQVRAGQMLMILEVTDNGA